MREALRDILPIPFACMVLLDGLFARRRHADSHVALCRDGAGLFFFSTAQLARARAITFVIFEEMRVDTM
jgi:hypothetical protein